MSAPIEPPVDPDVEPVAPEENQEPDAELSAFAKDKIAKANREAANLRQRLKEQEPLVKAAQEAEEANKSEVQRATERATALEKQLAEANLLAERNGLAAQFAIPETHFRYIVGTTTEERADAAKGIADLLKAQATPQVTAPPSNRTVENLRPGASPTQQDNQPPTEYPAWWTNKPRSSAQ